jgi:arylsulfatase A-like enzyme
VLDALDRGGQAANTLVIFTSDHGDMAGAHRQFIKGWQPYEETYRVPLVLRWPDVIAPGGVCERLVQLHDLAHTFADIAGAAPICPTDGRSLLPLLRDPQGADWEDVAFCCYYGGEFLYTQRMVITPRYKYVFNGFDCDELYDLARDPHEIHNVLDDPAYAAARDDLRTLLWQQMERYGDPYAQNRYGAARYLPRPVPRTGPWPSQ